MKTETDRPVSPLLEREPAAAPHPAPAPRPDRIVIQSDVPVLDTGMFEHMYRIAKIMASSSLVPAHLNSVRKVGQQEVDIDPQEAAANCFLVVNQAARWRMDPFAVAQHVYVTKGRIGYEGKLVAAVINSHPAIESRLTYSYEGTGEGRKVTVSAKLKGDTEPRTVQGTVKDWKTTGTGSPWGNVNQHDQMLSYRGAREWSRRWLPEAILGVWGDDELEIFDSTAGGRTAGDPPAAGERTGASALKDHLRSGAERASDAVVVDTGTTTTPAAEAPKVAEPAEAPAAPGPGAQAEPKADKPAAEAKGAQKSEAPPKAGDPGTPALKEKVMAGIAACSDVDVLGFKRDEANFFKWSPDDMKDIDAAYNKKRAELVG